MVRSRRGGWRRCGEGVGLTGSDAASSLTGGAGEREMWVDRLIGRKGSSAMAGVGYDAQECDGAHGVAAVGRSMGRRGVGRSGRRRARRRGGPIAEGRRASMQCRLGAHRTDSRAPIHQHSKRVTLPPSRRCGRQSPVSTQTSLQLEIERVFFFRLIRGSKKHN